MFHRNRNIIIAVVIIVIVLYRTRFNKKRSILNSHDYEYMKDFLKIHIYVYEDPENFTIKDDKLVCVSLEINDLEALFNHSFKDKIPWCLPPLYADLEMQGPFPTIEQCGLNSLCKTLKENLSVFMEEFNTGKDQFVENPEKIGYNNTYGRVDINGGTGFDRTKEILNRFPQYKLAQMFNRYARYNFMSTTFTVLYPGSKIRPHHGPTNFKYRIHLCLDIDGDGGIITAYGTRRWVVGEIFILDDSYLHAGFYEGTRPRVILMVDIPKQSLKHTDVDRFIESNEVDKKRKMDI